MDYSPFKKNIAQTYLSLVPFVGVILAFTVGYVSYKIYLPIWILNILLMTGASWILGLRVIKTADKEQRILAVGAFLFIVPFILVSLFAGLGPPPETATKWLATATEQQIRYFMLTTVGIIVVLAYSIVTQQLKNSGEKLYSMLGLTCLTIALPLFIVTMLFWGFYLPELFKIQITSLTHQLPDWYSPIRQLFGLLSVVEVALTYLATLFLALSFKKTEWFQPLACTIYIVISAVCFLIIVLSAFLPDPIFTMGYVVSIPAFPFLLFYFMGINLLRKVGK